MGSTNNDIILYYIDGTREKDRYILEIFNIIKEFSEEDLYFLMEILKYSMKHYE